MREIRLLGPEHIDDYTDIAFNAYPSFKDFEPEAMAAYKKEAVRIMTEDPIVTFYGMFEDNDLIAVMRLFDFEMNAFGKVIPVSGLGFLGVHLMHKKKGVAKEMVRFYEDHFRSKNVPIAILLPFRPDFYKKMGYGHGTKMNQYRVRSQDIPSYDDGSGYNIEYLNRSNLNEILECHDRVVSFSHGRMRKFGDEIRDLFGDPFNRVIGCRDGENILRGYMVGKFSNGKAGNYTINHLTIKELIHENTFVLKDFLTFLRKQADQVTLTIFNTEDEYFHHLFDNPLNDSQNYIPYGYLETNTQAIGAMYKVLDVAEAFRQCGHRNYNGISLNVRFLIADPFGGAEEDVTLMLQCGKAMIGDAGCVPDATVSMALSDFSSMFLGCIGFKGLYDLGLASVDTHEAGAYTVEKLVGLIDLAFYQSQKPVCYTDF